MFGMKWGKKRHLKVVEEIEIIRTEGEILETPEETEERIAREVEAFLKERREKKATLVTEECEPKTYEEIRAKQEREGTRRNTKRQGSCAGYRMGFDAEGEDF